MEEELDAALKKNYKEKSCWLLQNTSQSMEDKKTWQYISLIMQPCVLRKLIGMVYIRDSFA